MTIDLDELERLEKAGTPGPWLVEPGPPANLHRHRLSDADGKAEPPCYCAETSTRNCPAHQNAHERACIVARLREMAGVVTAWTAADRIERGE